MLRRILSHRSDETLIDTWDGFDRDWYVRKYGLAGRDARNPAGHYIRTGAALGYDPAPGFDADYYLNANADVKEADANPLVHYLRHGRDEGRQPFPSKSDHAIVVALRNSEDVEGLLAIRDEILGRADLLIGYPDGIDIERMRSAFPAAFLITYPADMAENAVMYMVDKLGLHFYGFTLVVDPRDMAARARGGDSGNGYLLSRDVITKVIEKFRRDLDIRMAGPVAQFVPGKENELKQAVSRQVQNDGVAVQAAGRNWGFFASGSFWVRGDVFDKIGDLKKAAGASNPSSNESLAYLLGLSSLNKPGSVLLIEAPKNDKFLSRQITDWGDSVVTMSEPLNTEGAQPAKLFGKIGKIYGGLDLRPSEPTINGWLAMIGDSRPREIIVRCDALELKAVASTLRRDLQDHAINEGRHSFAFPVPAELMDGKSRQFELIDVATDAVIVQKSCAWQRPPRPYKTFKDFIHASMTQPVVMRPFCEEDKRCFAVMENIADSLVDKSSRLSAAPLVSVVMPVYNREGLVKEAVNSVLAQSYVNFELIIVDDGSTDRSVAEISAYEDPRIRLIELGVNGGHARARNAGLDASRGEIIAYLDSDNRWDDRYLAAIVGAYGELPEADGLITGQLLYRGGDADPYAVRYGHMNCALLENRNYMDLNAFSHRREILQQVSGFDTSLRRFVDYDLILRVGDAGNVYSVPVILSHYYLGRAEATVTNGNPYPEDMKAVVDALEMRTRKRLEKLGQQRLTTKVTVVIPNWQGLDDLRECLDGIHDAHLGEMVEVVIVDNNSSQDVVEFLRDQQHLARIKLIENAHNMGFTYAVNQGILAADNTSDVLVLNNDAILQPGAIQELQVAAYTLPSAGMTVPRQILPPGTKTNNVHNPYADPSRPSDANISAHHENIASVALYHDGGPVELNYAPFFAVYIRRDVLDEIGLLDAEYGRHYRSDRVYCDKMAALSGRKMYYVPTAHAIHKLQKATESLRDDTQQPQMFELMFRQNQWTPEDRAGLGYRRAPWDVF